MAKSKSVPPPHGAQRSDNSAAALGIYSQEMHRHVFWEENLQQRLVVAECTVNSERCSSLDWTLQLWKERHWEPSEGSSLSAWSQSVQVAMTMSQEWRRRSAWSELLPQNPLSLRISSYFISLLGNNYDAVGRFGGQRPSSIIWIQDGCKQGQDFLSRNWGWRFRPSTTYSNFKTVTDPFCTSDSWSVKCLDLGGGELQLLEL